VVALFEHMRNLLTDQTRSPWILAEVLKICKGTLRSEPSFQEYYLALRQKALEDPTPENLWIYGAAMPEEAAAATEELDAVIFNNLLDSRTLEPADCEFVLGYIRQNGYDRARQIENEFVRILGGNPTEEELLSVLPLVQRFLSNPDQLHDK
jgi:hypothetical protein